MKVIGFVRTSTQKQKNSISNQIQTITQFCGESDEFKLLDIIQEEGVSGDSLVRNGFDKMVAMIDNNEIDGVICLNLSRIGRKAALNIRTDK